jgi:hypothetical protein
MIQYLCVLPADCIYGFRMILRITAIIPLNSVNQLIFEMQTCLRAAYKRSDPSGGLRMGG